MSQHSYIVKRGQIFLLYFSKKEGREWFWKPLINKRRTGIEIYWLFLGLEIHKTPVWCGYTVKIFGFFFEVGHWF